MREELDEKYWNERYISQDFGWDLGAISTPLQEYFDQLHDKKARILIPGAGNAYEAEYLVNNDFKNVFVCDLAEEPLKNLSARCPKIKKENLMKIDFFNISEDIGGYDLIVEQTFFCAIHPSPRKKYFEKMNSLLKKGGKLVGVLFNDRFSVSPPFGGSSEEYKGYFDGLFKINVYETCINSIKPRAGRELFINLEKV